MKLLLVMLVLVTACEKKEQASFFSAVEGEPEQQTSAEMVFGDAGTPGADAEQEAPNDATLSRAIQLEGTPYDNVEGELVLKYEGPAGEFDLFRAVGDRQSVSGKAPLETGMVVAISRTMVIVKEPRILTAKHDLDVIATRWDRVASRSGKEDLHPIKAGEQVKLLKAVNETQCWMAIAADEFVAGCPLLHDFAAEGWNGEPTAVDSEWWVKTAIGGARGWLPVDEVSFSWEFKSKKKRRR